MRILPNTLHNNIKQFILALMLELFVDFTVMLELYIDSNLIVRHLPG